MYYEVLSTDSQVTAQQASVYLMDCGYDSRNRLKGGRWQVQVRTQEGNSVAGACYALFKGGYRA